MMVMIVMVIVEVMTMIMVMIIKNVVQEMMVLVPVAQDLNMTADAVTVVLIPINA